MSEIGCGKNFPPQHPTFRQKVISYILLAGLVVPVVQVFMHVLNRTRLIGKKNLRGLKRPWILMSNHVTLLDDLFLGPLIFFPASFSNYRAIPLHSPEERNFYKVPIVSWFMKNTRSIPILRGKGIHQEGVNRLIETLRDGGTLHIHPEGTRTRSGEIGPAKASIGRIVYETGSSVVPMYHRGLEHILPIGTGVPRIGKRIYAGIGNPIFFTEEFKLPNNPETWRLITKKIMAGIREEQARIEALLPADMKLPRSDPVIVSDPADDPNEESI